MVITMTIREMTRSDTECVIEMMTVFYASPAVHTNGSREIFENDIAACVGDCPFLEGYIFDENGEALGYGMLAKSFSTEFGKPCIWIEDIYIKPEHRGRGIGGEFLAFVTNKYADAVVRLEVEEENTRAIHVYEKGGFEGLPYTEMIRL